MRHWCYWVKPKAISKYLPQNNVVIEYRNDPASIQYDDRIEIQQPLFLAIDEIWAYINQPTLNPQVHINENAYKSDIKMFNCEDFTKAKVVEAIKEFIPNFKHEEKVWLGSEDVNL